ncbi:cation:proton antiporter [Winogradskyella ouciana]|uniref:Sodium:proton antiporter n=1 Tax=Winogradskyella ouciana TaxID=2608631 RepID=A0A7K1GF32_9FLAO|nr:cation:proton antiporter [Winogradskyella ouciana]MTE27645.1 sodium:proton antiporter [Winogradskyella ouciana]
MDTDIWFYLIVGLMGLLLPWLKKIEQFQLINVPIVAILVGLTCYLLPINLPIPNPIKYNDEILRLTEITVIISIMGAGLKLNHKFSLKNYRIPLLLVGITMIGCIASVALLGWWIGLVPASALLLAAVFAPTDPVLASDIQVEIEETTEEEHPVQYYLTVEAGINDGMAFPFTWLAILLALNGMTSMDWVSDWFIVDVLYRIIVGIIIGYVTGRVIAWLFFELPDRVKIAPKRLGFLAVAITFFIYGVTEAAHAYGFIAVFVSAVTIRQFEKQHQFHKEMHDVVAQVELFLITIILVFLGGYIATYWFKELTLPLILICLGFIFVIRPVFGILPTLKSKMSWKERWAVSFLGIKGIGSFFYLAFALSKADFLHEETLWSTVSFLVLVSIIVHRLAGVIIKKKLL